MADNTAAEHVALALQSVTEIQRGVDIAVIAITAGRFMEARNMLTTVGKLTSLCERTIQAMREPIARDALAPLLDLADWHDTKADKARRFPGGTENVAVMEKAAQVHEDAARRIREVVSRG